MNPVCSSHRQYNLKQILKEMLRVAAREIYLLIFFLSFHFVSVITGACVVQRVYVGGRGQLWGVSSCLIR